MSSPRSRCDDWGVDLSDRASVVTETGGVSIGTDVNDKREMASSYTTM